MSSAELLLTLIIAVVVFGPSKLEMLARHLGLAYKKTTRFKEQLSIYWEQQLKILELKENTHKAEQADFCYNAQNKDDENKS